jgi:hypothetical protein
MVLSFLPEAKRRAIGVGHPARLGAIKTRALNRLTGVDFTADHAFSHRTRKIFTLVQWARQDPRKCSCRARKRGEARLFGYPWTLRISKQTGHYMSQSFPLHWLTVRQNPDHALFPFPPELLGGRRVYR